MKTKYTHLLDSYVKVTLTLKGLFVEENENYMVLDTDFELTEVRLEDIKTVKRLDSLTEDK